MISRYLRALFSWIIYSGFGHSRIWFWLQQLLLSKISITNGGITFFVFRGKIPQLQRRPCLFCIASLVPEGRKEARFESQEICRGLLYFFQLHFNLKMRKGALIQFVVCVCTENQEMGSPLVSSVGLVKGAVLDLFSCFSVECREKKQIIAVTVILPTSY